MGMRVLEGKWGKICRQGRRKKAFNTLTFITALQPLMFLTPQCPREGHDGSSVSFYQVEIRSANKPITTFYKIRSYQSTLASIDKV